ncbi:hypothetical protein Amsp01_048900 [Amycolatopsis sp. NBRC 101858]|nr:hypothetical protein Amsp01_048900 [Amycolatopsis sp. NBRC 101858]
MLTIPEPVWHAVLDAFATAPPGHERVAYLDGVRFHDATGVRHGVATTVTLPDAHTTPGNYQVSARAMEQAGSHFEVLELVRLAQVHTHGNDWVNHSRTDDGRAYSQMDDALSLVLPHHAAGRPTPFQAGVHLRGPQGWRRLHRDELENHVRLLPGTIDHRRHPWNACPTGTKETSTDASTPSTTSTRWPSRWWSRRKLPS